MSNETFGYTGRLSGLFVAPNTGNFSFMVCSNDAAEIYFSTSADPASKVLVAHKDGPCSNGQPWKGNAGDQISLVEGELS